MGCRFFTAVNATHADVEMPLAPFQALFDCLYFSRRTPVILTASITEPEAIEVPMQRMTMPQSLKDAMAAFSASTASVLQSGKTSRDALYRVRSQLWEEAWKCSWEAGVVSVPEDAYPTVPVRSRSRRSVRPLLTSGRCPASRTRTSATHWGILGALGLN